MKEKKTVAMTYDEFLTQAIERGLASIKTDDQLLRHPKRMAGSREGFEACRGKDPAKLAELLEDASKKSDAVRKARLGETEDGEHGERPDIEDYWQARYRAIQIEWVCNTVSAALMFATDLRPESKKFCIVQPTARGLMNAARILKGDEALS